jgi:mycothiol synthase
MDALEVDVITEPEPGTDRQVVELVDRASAALGHPALSEHKRIELDRRMRSSVGTTGREGTDDVSVGLAAREAGEGAILGYAQVSGDSETRHYAVELVVDPEQKEPGVVGDRVADALLGAANGVVAARGGGTLRLWVAEAGDVDDARASEHGFQPERDLIQMRCPLPLPAPGEPGTEVRIETRPFRPGVDEEAWLSTNNRAFVSHPEQGHWKLATLLEREHEPWFDPEGLLVLEVEGRLAGSCWTKVHDRTEPPMGEIYVIGVDPDFHGRGWGRALTRAGLDWLASRGLTVGMLYVDGDNRVAVSMYRSMGFEADHVDRAYLKRVDPPGRVDPR